jgi:hypothetical protein
LLLSNWTIDALRDYPGKHHSAIVVTKAKTNDGSDAILFRLLTDFDNAENSQDKIRHGRSWDSTHNTLGVFGVRVEDWKSPTVEEINSGYKAACNVYVPAGFQREA